MDTQCQGLSEDFLDTRITYLRKCQYLGTKFVFVYIPTWVSINFIKSSRNGERCPKFFLMKICLYGYCNNNVNFKFALRVKIKMKYRLPFEPIFVF